MAALPPFLEKLQLIASSCDPKYGHWSDDGQEFIVCSEEFQSCVLEKFFKGTLKTFIRQLHFYCFKKSEAVGETWSFSHPKFHRDHPEWIFDIKRKTRMSGTAFALKTDVDDLRESVDEIDVLKAEISSLKTQVAALYTALQPQLMAMTASATQSMSTQQPNSSNSTTSSSTSSSSNACSTPVNASTSYHTDANKSNKKINNHETINSNSEVSTSTTNPTTLNTGLSGHTNYHQHQSLHLHNMLGNMSMMPSTVNGLAGTSMSQLYPTMTNFSSMSNVRYPNFFPSVPGYPIMNHLSSNKRKHKSKRRKKHKRRKRQSEQGDDEQVSQTNNQSTMQLPLDDYSYRLYQPVITPQQVQQRQMMNQSASSKQNGENQNIGNRRA